MNKKDISGGVIHEVPTDLKKALLSNSKALETWEDITPLARNEWICWIESAQKPETRNRRIEWGCSSLKEGKRRPCCWPGCSHSRSLAQLIKVSGRFARKKSYTALFIPPSLPEDARKEEGLIISSKQTYWK